MNIQYDNLCADILPTCEYMSQLSLLLNQQLVDSSITIGAINLRINSHSTSSASTRAMTEAINSCRGRVSSEFVMSHCRGGRFGCQVLKFPPIRFYYMGPFSIRHIYVSYIRHIYVICTYECICISNNVRRGTPYQRLIMTM